MALRSDDTVPSTPLASDNAIFSDTAQLPSSPPSSPPGFPWEQPNYGKAASPAKLARPSINALSVLGKRKALDPISDNARPAKKTTSAKKNNKALTQMQISLGQEVQKKCKDCGMEYIACSAEDRKLHDKYHMESIQGYDVSERIRQKTRPGTILVCWSAYNVILAIDAQHESWRRKRAKGALDVVQRELGAVDISNEELWSDIQVDASGARAGRYVCYMRIQGTKCVGFLLAERITEARKVAKQPVKAPVMQQATPGERPVSALVALKARRSLSAAEPQDEGPPGPITLSKQPSPAGLGISRIWTAPRSRKQKIASELLDTALAHHAERLMKLAGYNDVLAFEQEPGIKHFDPTWHARPSPDMKARLKELVAFSQPTEAGARLARKWFGKRDGWLVYVD
jgi:N-acetyltransferase